MWYAHFVDVRIKRLPYHIILLTLDLFPGVQVDPSRQRERYGRFYYDGDAKKVAIRENATVGYENRTYYHEIFDHEKVQIDAVSRCSPLFIIIV